MYGKIKYIFKTGNCFLTFYRLYQGYNFIESVRFKLCLHLSFDWTHIKSFWHSAPCMLIADFASYYLSQIINVMDLSEFFKTKDKRRCLKVSHLKRQQHHQLQNVRRQRFQQSPKLPTRFRNISQTSGNMVFHA